MDRLSYLRLYLKTTKQNNVAVLTKMDRLSYMAAFRPIDLHWSQSSLKWTGLPTGNVPVFLATRKKVAVLTKMDRLSYKKRVRKKMKKRVAVLTKMDRLSYLVEEEVKKEKEEGRSPH